MLSEIPKFVVTTPAVTLNTTYLYGNSGTIHYENVPEYEEAYLPVNFQVKENITWHVSTNCSAVHVNGTLDISEAGYVQIGSARYHEEINHVIYNNSFIIQYVGYGVDIDVINVNWGCYGEWYWVGNLFTEKNQKYGFAIGFTIFVLFILWKRYRNSHPPTNENEVFESSTPSTDLVFNTTETMPLRVTSSSDFTAVYGEQLCTTEPVTNIDPQFDINDPAYMAPPSYEDAMSKPY